MRTRYTRHWPASQDPEILLFFCQRIQELLFDYTISTYKFYALNPCYLISETLQIFGYVENKKIEDKHLLFVLEELNSRINDDSISKSLLGKHKADYFPLNDIMNLRSIKTKLEILRNKLSPPKYLSETISQLKAAIVSKEKSSICTLSSSFITTCINMGYHQNYIYYESINVFNNPKNSITDFDTSLNRFFGLFDAKKKIFKIV